MKKLLGILFCFGFLFAAGTVGAQAMLQPNGHITVQKMSFIGDGASILQTDYTGHVSGVNETAMSSSIDINILHQASKAAADETLNALTCRYKLVPASAERYIRQERHRYYLAYLYHYPVNYNQYPTINSI